MTIQTLTEGSGGYLLSEANGTRSRDVVTLVITAVILRVGTILGQITAGGNYTEWDPAAIDGSQTAVAVLFNDAPINVATQEVVITSRDAEVNRDELAFLPSGAPTAPQIAAAIVDLAAVGIIVRASV